MTPQMLASVTVRLCDDGTRPIVTFFLSNHHIANSATIKFLFIMSRNGRQDSYERTWEFRFPRPIQNELSLALIGVNYTAAIFEGLLRGLTIGVVDGPQPQADYPYNEIEE
jgi:hypothetical protein